MTVSATDLAGMAVEVEVPATSANLGAGYDVLALALDVSLRVDVTGPAGGARLTPAERGLLLHAVRDLHDGLIGVGHATTRGYGSLRLSAESATVLDELAPPHPTGAAVLALLRGEDA